MLVPNRLLLANTEERTINTSTTVSHLPPLSGFLSTTQLQCEEEEEDIMEGNTMEEYTMEGRSLTQLSGGLLVSPPHLCTPAGSNALFVYEHQLIRPC